MNHLLSYESLENHYVAIRHGQSIANQQGLIVSTPENGISGYGLSDHGKIQVRKSISEYGNIANVSLIVSSDFKRAYETALIAHEVLQDKVSDIIQEVALRERNFGDFELARSENYQTIWDRDASDPNHTLHQVESAESVMTRVSRLVQSLEGSYTGQTILLVSHGDTLQILQTAFEKKPASSHRNLPPLETAEVRKFLLIS